MKLTLAETRLLKDSLSIIADLVTEVHLKVGKDKLEIIAMDPANVAMVIFNLLSSAFVNYEVKSERMLALNLNDLKQVMKRVKPKDTLTLSMSEEKLKITLKSNTTREFYLSLIDIEEREQKVPKLDFKAEVNTLSEIFTEAIEDADIVGESVTFLVEPKKLRVLSSSDLSKAVIEIPADKETTIEVSDSVKSKYSIEYLKKMMQAGKIAESVTIKLANEYPLQLNYVLKDKMQLSFILAPRVDND